VEIRQVEEGDGLERLVAVYRAVDEERAGGVAAYADWERQADAAEWLVAEEDGEDVAAGHLIVGWHNAPDHAWVDVRVLPAARGRGAGSALLAELARRAEARGLTGLEAELREGDGASVAWAERRGFAEAGRESRLVLDLAEVEPPAPEPPDGIRIVTWAERPELARGLYEVYVEAEPDIPGNEQAETPAFERWLDADMSGIGDRAEAVFVALAGDEVVGYAKLAFSDTRQDMAYHDLTGVKRAWRGRGIAGALKRTQIAWAKRNGYARLVTSNEERNVPIRTLNERYGYRPEPGEILMRGPIPHRGRPPSRGRPGRTPPPSARRA
jgi:GNAT superfamily N-acetyltransferase